METQEERRERLRQTFSRSERPDETRALKTTAQWEDYNEAITRADAARAQASRLFKERFAVRVGREVKRLQAASGAKKLDFKYTLGGSDGFHPARLQEHAERIVHLRHEQRLTRIDMAEASTKLKVSREAIDEALKEAQQRLRSHWREATRGRSR